MNSSENIALTRTESALVSARKGGSRSESTSLRDLGARPHHIEVFGEMRAQLSSLAVAFLSRSSRSYTTTRSALQASTKYVLHYDYVSDVLEKRGPFREKHLQLAQDLCLSGGPVSNLNEEVPTGALFVFGSPESAQAFVEQDPYVSGGIVTKHSIQEWTVAIEN